jgi:tetratricopeptide (TPR) repeat protein
MKTIITACIIYLGSSIIYSQCSLSTENSLSRTSGTQIYLIKEQYDTKTQNRLAFKNAEYYLERGLQKERSGDRKGAIVDFSTAIRINPKYADAYFYRGTLKFVLSEDDDRRNNNGRLVQMGDRRPAILDLNKAIALKPNYPRAYQMRGYAKAFMGDMNDAILDLNKGAEIARKQGDIEIYEALKSSANLVKSNIICLATCPDVQRH